MVDRIKLHKETIGVQVDNLVKYAEQLEWENKRLKDKLEDMKKVKHPPINNSTHLIKTLTMVLGLFKAMDFFGLMEDTIVKPITGLREYIHTHKTEINEYIDNHPEFFKIDNE